MARNRPVKLASARALAASAACNRASLSFTRAGGGLGFRWDSAAGGGNVGEFDMCRTVSAKPTLEPMVQACRLWFECGLQALNEDAHRAHFPPVRLSTGRAARSGLCA